MTKPPLLVHLGHGHVHVHAAAAGSSGSSEGSSAVPPDAEELAAAAVMFTDGEVEACGAFEATWNR